MVEHREDESASYNTWEKATELPLLALAVVLIPVVVLPLLVDLSATQDEVLEGINWLVWAFFALDYVVRLFLARAKWKFVRREWPDLLIVLLPFLRPLRIVHSLRALQLLRLVRLAAVLAGVSQSTHKLLRQHKLRWALMVALVVVIAGASLGYVFEAGSESGNIDSYADALWWAMTTITTVGYGDTFPVTPEGRGVAVLLMLCGISLFGVVTANLAAFLTEQGSESEGPSLEMLSTQIAELQRTVDELRAERGSSMN